MKVSPSNHGQSRSIARFRQMSNLRRNNAFNHGASRSVTVRRCPPRSKWYGVPTKQHFSNKRPKNLTFPTMTQYNECIGKIQLFAIIDPQGTYNCCCLQHPYGYWFVSNPGPRKPWRQNVKLQGGFQTTWLHRFL